MHQSTWHNIPEDWDPEATITQHAIADFLLSCMAPFPYIYRYTNILQLQQGRISVEMGPDCLYKLETLCVHYKVQTLMQKLI